MRFLLTVIFCIILTGFGWCENQVYMDNVVIVLDASGSMKDMMRPPDIRKIDAAKTALKEVLKTLPQTTQVGLLVFGGRQSGWVYPLGERNDEQLISSIDSMTANGSTPLGKYMKMGADRLLESRLNQYGYGSYRLLVVTDGEANDSELVNSFTPEIISRGVVIDAIGVGMAKAHTLATKVHSYRSANDPQSLQMAIKEVFAEVGKSAVDQTGEEIFAELSGLTTEAALAIIEGMSASGNHPIGTKPKADKPILSDQSDSEHLSPSVQPKVVKDSGGSKKSSNKFGYLLLVVFIFIFLKKLGKLSSGKRN